MRRRGDVVSKREVLDNVWDVDFEGDPNIVEVYVRHLRNKLDRPFEREAIETLRGAGYRLASNGG
jgi:DNA-binding response OmpR family regulator